MSYPPGEWRMNLFHTCRLVFLSLLFSFYILFKIRVLSASVLFLVLLFSKLFFYSDTFGPHIMRMLESCITKLEEKKMKFPYFLKKKNAWMLRSNEVLKAPEVSSWEDASKLFSFPSLCIKNLFILWKLSIFIFYSLFYSCMCFVNIFCDICPRIM